MASAQQASDRTDTMVPVDKTSARTGNSKTQVLSSRDEKITTTSNVGREMGSFELLKDAQEEAGFLGKGGEQSFFYPPNVHVAEAQPYYYGAGYINPLGQWEEYPHYVNVDSSAGIYNENQSQVSYPGYTNNPQFFCGPYSPMTAPIVGDGQSYFPQHFPFASPYYHQPASPSMTYQPDIVLPKDTFLADPSGYLLAPSSTYHHPFTSFDTTSAQTSGVPGYFGQSSIPSGLYQGSFQTRQQSTKFGGTTPSLNIASRRTNGAVEKGLRPGKGSFLLSSQIGSLDFLTEQNRGPRATKLNKQDPENNSSPEDKNEKTSLLVDQELYNRSDFVTEYKDTKFFVIKSYTEDNVHKSIKYGVWASTSSGNRKLDSAYREAKKKEDPCPIFLFFSVNGSSQFCGVAEMIGPVDFEKSVDYWQQDKWSGQFPVKWHIVKDVPNNVLRHIILENNENKPVTNSRDTQEVKLELGLQMLTIFKDQEAETTILEDFEYYDQREKNMLQNRARYQLSTSVGSEVQKETNDGIVNQISEQFTSAVKLEERKNTDESTESTLPVSDSSTADKGEEHIEKSNTPTADG